MSNPHIIYNGVSSETLGLVIERLPDWNRAPRKYEEHDIPGRSQPLIIDGGGYESYSTTIEVNTFGVPVRDVYAWLRGEGWMISSDEPEYKAYVHLVNQITDNRFRVGRSAYDTLQFNLLVEPYLRLVNEPLVTMTADGFIPGQGCDKSQPVITVYGAGDVTLMVGRYTVMIEGMANNLTIDCDAGVAYTTVNGEKVFAGGLVTLVAGWPQLNCAYDEINQTAVSWTGAATRIEVQPNWRFL